MPFALSLAAQGGAAADDARAASSWRPRRQPPARPEPRRSSLPHPPRVERGCGSALLDLLLDHDDLVRVAAQLPRPGLLERDDVLEARAEAVGEVDAGLDREDVARDERLCVAGDDERLLVLVEPDAVAGAVEEVLPVARIGDDRTRGRVDRLARRSDLSRGEAGFVGADDDLVLREFPLVGSPMLTTRAPLAAYISRRNILLGLSFWGLIFANGIVSTLARRRAMACGPPPSCSSRCPFALTPSRFAGRTARSWAWRSPAEPSRSAALFGGYGLYKAGVIGNTGLLVYACVIGFTPLILAAIASPFFKRESLRPVLALQASA